MRDTVFRICHGLDIRFYISFKVNFVNIYILLLFNLTEDALEVRGCFCNATGLFRYDLIWLALKVNKDSEFIR